jgi:hypothetical protein
MLKATLMLVAMAGIAITGPLGALAFMFASSAKAADVDWKLYGGASVAGPGFCFYDANSVASMIVTFPRSTKL